MVRAQVVAGWALVLVPLAVAVAIGLRLAAWTRRADHSAEFVYGLAGFIGLTALWLAFAGVGAWVATRPTVHEESLAGQVAFRQRR